MSEVVVGLREAREGAGLDVAALAALLKVPVARLEALESGRYHELPDMTFARALASSVCRALKVDPVPVLAALPATSAVRLGEPAGRLNAPLPASTRTPFGGSVPSVGGWRLPLAPALAVLVLAAAVLLWFVLPAQVPEPEVQAQEPIPLVPPDMAAPVEPPASAVGSAQPAAVPVAAPDPFQARSFPIQAVPDVGATAPPTVQPPVPSGAPVSLAPVGVVAVHIRVRQPSWVQVTGASGRVWLQRSLQAAEAVDFFEDVPLSVVIGNAAESEVKVRGQALDLVPVTRNNVARFDVK